MSCGNSSYARTSHQISRVEKVSICHTLSIEYWNHNSAYHALIVDVARSVNGDVLDVGCGEGLLVERLASVSRTVTGIDKDVEGATRARARLTEMSNANIEIVDFLDIDIKPNSYDVVTMVATLHHLDLERALTRVKELLRPKGTLIVVGLAANSSFGDWVLSFACFPVVRLMGLLHQERRDIHVVTTAPIQDLREIRDAARILLPGSKIRRGVYYRYILTWTKS